MRDGELTTKRDGELLAELLDIPKAVFETRTLREIMTAPQAIKGIGEKCKKGTIITCTNHKKVRNMEDVRTLQTTIHHFSSQ